jgi:hypothetical protein
MIVSFVVVDVVVDEMRVDEFSPVLVVVPVVLFEVPLNKTVMLFLRESEPFTTGLQYVWVSLYNR